jgi:Spore coat polysaccharide biosynthesis protein F, CMP-KDO synthetase homolog
MKKTGIIIQARLGSTRLKNKVLKKIYGKTIIEIMLDRLSFSNYQSNIIVAIPNNKKK